MSDLNWFATQLMGFEIGCSYVYKDNDVCWFSTERLVGSYSLAEIDAERVRLGLDPNDYRVKGSSMYEPITQ